jgi:hypothetical protein
MLSAMPNLIGKNIKEILLMLLCAACLCLEQLIWKLSTMGGFRSAFRKSFD